MTRTLANRDTAGYINCNLIRGGPMSTRFPVDLKKENPNGYPPRMMSSKYHVPYLCYLAAASQPSFDTGNVPSTMRSHYFIKLCFREISTPPSVQSTQSNFLEIIISWRILRLDFNDLIGATAAKHRGLINSKIKTKFSIF